MNDLGKAIVLAAKLYGDRASVAYSGYVKRDPLTLLQLSRVDPYPVCARIRAVGGLVPASPGKWVSATYRVCDSVLRGRRFGTLLDEDDGPAEPDIYHLSFMAMNPPDHTRLRRLASPAFSLRPVASYAEKIERTVGRLLDRADEAGTFDLVPAFAAPVPIAVISELLGIPDSMSADFTHYGMTPRRRARQRHPLLPRAAADAAGSHDRAPDAGRAHARPGPGGRHPKGRRLDAPRAAVPAGHRRAPAGRRAPECAGREHHRGPLGVIGVSKRPIA